MWTKEQIEKSKRLLREISTTDYNDIHNTYISKLDKEFGYLVICEIRSLLLKNKLIYTVDKDEYHVKLTPIGNFANKYGIIAFIVLEYISIIFLKVLPVLISIFALWISYQAIGISRETQSQYRTSQTNKIQNTVYNDSISLVKIKNFIKHDSVFLNELKLELKEKQHKEKITTP